MPVAKRIRTLLGPADPARRVTLPPVTATAAGELIARAEAAPDRTPVPRRVGHRRPLALAAAALMIAGTVAVVSSFDPGTPAGPDGPGAPLAGLPTVLVPIAYQIPVDPPPAGPKLDDLAASIVATDYDGVSDGYAYHHQKRWGGITVSAPGGHDMLLAEELRTWSDRDGVQTTWQRHLAPEFPDEASRRHWEQLADLPTPAASFTVVPLVADGPVPGIEPLPADPAGLARVLRLDAGAAGIGKAVNSVYGKHLVPRQSRAQILRALAGVPDFRWRGEVSDRAGRVGVAITADDEAHGYQEVLIFDPRTGELLAHERVRLTTPRAVMYYNLFLDYARTPEIG